MDTKKKKIVKITGIVAIFLMLIGVIGISIYKQNEKVTLQGNPEIRRSMEYQEVQEGDENTNSQYVQFDAFFLRDLDGDGYAESIRGTCRDISETDTLYMDINVLTNGTLKNGKITINAQNINLQTALVEDNVVKNNYISNNTTTIELKDMKNGTQKLMYGTIKASSFGNDTTKYSKINSITLTGTHIADDGTPTQVNKTVNFTVDWHGDVQTSIYNYSGTQNIENIVDDSKQNMTLSFSVTTRENIKELILKDAVLEGTLPEINGYKPISVETTSNNVSIDYNEETRTFTLKKESTLGSNGIVSNTVSNSNTFSLKVTYPYEAYESLTEDILSIQVPVKAYYEGYNNPNPEFENPIKSNIAERTITFLWRKQQPVISAASFDVTIGTYRSYDRKYVISKKEPLKLYNGVAEETEDLYKVKWEVYTGNQVSIDSIQLKETQTPYSDRFLNNSGTYFNMSDYTSNVGIYFTGAENTLGENGYIKVINDETGEEIHTFTKDDWEKYNSSNPYTYESPVKHIRIETSKANKSSSLYVYNIKKIDDNVLVKTFTREEFDKLQEVYTYLTGGIKQEGSTNYTSVNDIASAIYEEPLSTATLTVNRDMIGTQTKEEGINLTIDAQSEYYNIVGWKNGKFIIELPREILDVEINDINISNSNVKILAYEIYEKNGQKFIRIETENENEETYEITINTNLTSDPRVATQTTNVKLYGYNESCSNYRQNTQDTYDIDGDENLQENVNYSTDNLYLVSPSSLLTNQQATDYNEAKQTAIAPQIATIDKVEADTATVNISITNNYSGTISDVNILGKIPFEGNSFTINGTSLGSNYTTQMLNEGITVPDDIKDKVTVYYSENENPTNDINNPENGWTTTPDFSKVKTYLIDLGDYVLQIEENRVFSYKIKVPSTVQYNDVSYSTHAVYFCLDTEQGKYRTQTETTKLGFKIERKYNFNIQKLKEDTEVPVQGATFSITADGEDETRIGTTNNSGNISIENLYVDKTYTLKEIRTPGSYESLEEEVKFKVSVQDDKLVLNVLSGEDLLKDSSIVQATTDARGTVNFVIENTPKYKLEITKKDNKTGNVLQGVKYRLEGEGLGSGIITTTNKEGKIVFTGLSQEVEYTLTETEADGYYVNKEPVKFKVENNSGKLNFVIISGSFESNSQVVIGTGITGLDAQDTVTAELTDEKIPTYQVQLKKFAKDEDMILKGAQYMITGEGIDEKGETYITDENGILTIPNLYEYVEGKYITGVYTLKEITPPEGYTLDERGLQFRATRNDQGNLELEIIGENFLRNSSVENADSENAVIKLELEDEPLFKITKIDGTTKTPIPNAKFVIYEIDESYNEIGYVKDINGNQIGIVQNGIPVVETDENGEISYGLKSGLYKAVEIEAPEGYELPENEENRTYYFGIDASKAQETTFGTSMMNQVSGTNWEKIESVDNTSDNGFVISGYFVDNADFNKDGISDIKVNSSEWSGFIAKYDEEGNLEFAKPVYTLDGETKLHKIIQTNDEGYVAVGYYTGSTLTVGDVNTGLTNTGANKKALVVKFGSSGNYEWSKEVEVSGTDVEATALGQNLQGNILVGITKTTGNAQIIEYSNVNGNVVNDAEIPAGVKVTGIEGENSQEAVIVSQGLTDTTTGRIDTYQDGNVTEKMILDFNANDVTRLENGKYVIVGNYTGTAQSTRSKGNYDGIISVYDMNSNIIESSKFVQGNSDDIVTSVKNTKDGGYIVGGYTYSDRAIFNESYIQQGSFVLKYSQDGTNEWQKEIWGDNYNEVTDITERDENEFVVVGYFNSSSVNSDSTDINSLSLTQYTDSFIFNYGEIVTAPEIPESSQITVNNNLEKYKITTDVEEVNGVKGGSISGEDEEPYETVEYGKDSTKEIKIIPNTGYKVVKITINDENYGFTAEEDGSVTLPNFTNMTSDKHIVVTFSNTASSVVVHHYIDGTEISVAPDETLSGNIGEYYTTAPKMNLEEYELKKVDGEYVIPDNASGTYTKEQQVVTYYYVKKQVAITVQHLIEGTDERVPLVSGEPSQDEIITGEIGTNYTTDALTPEELSPKYELSIIPDNQNGVYTNDETIVIYYYKAKNVEVTTEVKTHKETNEMGEEVDVKGGNISGEGQTPYETVVYGEDSQKDIVITPDENYQVKEILVNDEPIIFSTEEDGTVILDKFIDMLEDKHVVVEFEKIPATVIVHHYIENTTDKVPSVDGGTVQDETKQGVVGDIYATKEAENVAPNYELVEVPENASGTMTKDIIVVIYYYKLKDPNIETPVITKESNVEKVTNVGQAIDYTVNYNAIIDTYRGDATITIVDTLPYEIDEVKSDIAGGVYNEDSKTITWTEEISNIDTFTNGAKQVNITKEITLVYKDVDTTKNSILNMVTGKVELQTPEKEETVEDEKEIPAEYFINIPVNKIWNDNTDEAGKRPNAVNIVVKNGTEEVAKQELNNSNSWTYTFENLPKYDDLGNVINYTVEEKEVNSGDLYFYDTNISGSITNGYTITNTFTVPGETVSVDVSKVWQDTEEQEDKRPTGVTVVLKNGDTEAGRQELNSTNGWTYTFTNLPKYNSLGNAINYTVEEVTTNKFYTSSIAGNMTQGYTITNTFTVPNETVDIPVNKVWSDNNNEAEKRPVSVTLKVTGNGEIYTQTINSSNEGNDENTWTYTFEDLPKYDGNGDEIEYTIDEEDINNEFYQKSEVNQETRTITNTFGVPGENVTIQATKVWNDNENAAGKRPESVTLQVKNGDAVVASEVVDAEDNWTTEFSVPKYDSLGNAINYTVDEADLESIFYSKENVTGNMTEGYTITNKFQVPGDKVEIPVTKVWNDNGNSANKRPDNITVKLTGSDGQEYTQELSSKNEVEGNTNNWTYTFTGLPKYDAKGDVITYTLSENPTGSIFYTEQNTVVDQESKTITNTFEVPDDKIEIPVTKVWNDNENAAGKRPENITVKLTGNDGQEYEQKLGITNGVQGNTNSWTYTFKGLPKYDENGNEIKYTLREDPTGSIFYTEANTDITGNMTEGYTVTNTFEVPDDKVSVDVSKVWVDTPEQQDKRPTSIKVIVKGNNKEEEAELNASSEWKHTFVNLPKYDSLGNIINYTVEEQEANSGDLKFYTYTGTSGNMESGYTITNTFEVPNDKIEIPVTKVWNDNNNEAGKRPLSVTLKVTGNGKTQTQVITAANVSKEDSNTWTYTFEGLAKYDENGDEITYTVDEENLNNEFYQKSDVNQQTRTITNTFEVPGEKVTVKATKVWNDNNGEAGKRPSSVTIQLKNGNAVVASEVVDAEDNWTTEFTASKYDSLGNEINYTVDEADLESIFYSKENVTGNMTEGFTVTNTFTVPNEKVSVGVSKVWVDTPEQQDKRPTGVTVVLKNGENEAGRQELNISNEWKYTFTNLAKYDSLGNVINYTVEEQGTNKFYSSSIAGDMTKGYTITNTFTVPDETVEIPVTKVWVDNNNEAQKRPSVVTLKVTGNGQTYTQTVNSSNAESDGNTWTYTFTELPKYDANGNEIKYTVDEENLNNEFYQKSDVNQETKTITNTFGVPGENVTIQATKVWNDNENAAGKRPESVTLQVKNGDAVVASEVVDAEDNWTTEFSVPKYDSLGNAINYTVDEADLESIFYSKENVTGNMTEGYTITNKFQVPGDKVEIPVTKVWNDNGNSANKRPDNITVKLTGSDGQEYTQELSSKNEVEGNTNTWTYTFTGLPKYDAKGNVITYTLSEEPTGSIFYTEQNTVVDQESKTITNTFEVPDDKIEIPVTKVWNDNGDSANKRPTNVTLKLTGSDGQEYKQDLSSKNEVEENTNNWTYTFTELPKYDAKGNVITYTLREEPTGSIFYTEANTDITGDMTNGYIVTNTFEVPGDTVSVDVNKVWVDTAKQQNKRPTGVTVVLKNGVEEAGIQELNSGNNWTYTFKNLAKYDSLGNEINYTVEEVTTNKFYTSSTAGDMASGYTITNTFTVPNETVDIPVTKVWADNNNEAGKRSLSVTLKVTGNGKIETQVITSANANKEDNNTWTYTFKGLQKYDENGDEIEYTVDEENLNNEFYQKVVDQGTRTITNIFEVPGEKVTVKATKVWNDNNDEAGKRPLNVTLQVKNGNAVVASEVVDAQDNWTAEFTVPKYDSLGNAINYTVDEADLGNMFYIKENVTGDMTSGFTITNTFEVPGDTVSVDVTKVWEDTEKQQDKRSTGVTVVLKDGDTEAGRQELNSGNNWTYTFKNLAKYDSLGNEINYTVEEVTTNKFYTSSIEGDMTKGYTITNTFTVPNETVDIPVIKVWNHGGNKGERPQEITLQVKNGQEVVRQAKVTEDDGWKYTFEDLPKYDGNGNEIKYTADEEENLEEYKKSIDGYTITNTYNGAVITGSKSATTEKNNGYVVAGEKITYTITVRNAGELAKEVIVKDTAPEGTTFVEGSIKVDNEVEQGKTETDLQNGISVNVPAKTEAGEGETRVSFEVTVNEEATGEIRNAGTIKESETVEEETNEVTTPVVKISKTSEVQRKTEGTLGANEVTAGDEITYKIKVENTSNTDIKDVEIEDSIPEGTSLKQINDNGMQEGNIIKWQIDVDKNSSIEVSFVVTVDYEGKDGSIKNVATVDGNETNETENPYKKQESKLNSSITKDGEDEITTIDEAVYYEINYEAQVEDHVGSATVTIVDKLPYGINVQESELAGGTYDAEARTITWEETIANIDTYKANEAKKITITKVISLKYDYGNIDEIGENLTNEVEGKIELKEGDEITKTDTVTADHTEKIKIPAKVIVHHYIYDEETDEYTEEKIAEDEIKNGIVGEDYSTTKSNSVPQNYECINETPEKYQGRMTYEDTEVTYYYKLKESSITSTIEKTASANKIETQEDGTELPVLTNERGQVTYNIKYNAEVNDYIGKVKIIVTDSLPAAIDEASSDLAGGKYDAEERTITWEEEVNVDTYANEKYTYNFNKTVKLVYVDQDVTEDIVNEVTGEIKIYYPDNYPEKGGEEVKTDEDEGTATVKQEYKVDKNVEKIWEDNNNSKGKRPSSVMIELTADGEVVENSQVELNSRNGWKHTYRELEKYDEIGREIEYSIIETEKNPGDLEYYEEPEIGGTNDIIVTNKYKLKETALKSDITKETETVITASNQEVPYTIHYEAEIDEYIGDAVVTIVDELPYKIDEEKSSLDGGIYNEELQTITWTKELGHINTDTSGEAYKVDITKNIILVYKDLDAKESRVTNKVVGTVELYETEEKNTVETEEVTQVEIEGTVVVKYVEKDTGKELETAEEMTGRVGEEYITLPKDIENYDLVGDTENTRGEYREGTIEVIYYYEKTPARVIVKYEDEEGKDLLPEKVVEGYVDQEYETKAEEIEEYELKEVIGQEKGEMTKDDIVIIYVYKKKEAGGVIVYYIDKETGEKLAEDEVIEGNIGDEYKTERKVIENYQKADPEPTNKEGTMTEETIEVTYYYERIPSGKITVKYVDKDTKEEITYEDETGEEKTYGYEIKGYVGEEYKTEEKEIPYYKIVENMLPINREGILSQNDETVTYYYEKMKFNMEISKRVKTVTIKGEEKEVSNGNLTKVEIHRKEITTTPVEIRYVITVSNTGEIGGKGEVVERIPEGFEVSSNNPSGWEVNTDGTMKYAVELKAGESKDIEVVLKWKASETNFGEKKNVALLTNVENPAGFEEENTGDNQAEATVIVTVATGKEISILIIVLGFIASAGSLILCYEYELYRKERNQPVRMVKLDGKNVVIKKEVQK